MCNNINGNHDEPDVIVYNASKWHVAIKGMMGLYNLLIY